MKFLTVILIIGVCTACTSSNKSVQIQNKNLNLMQRSGYYDFSIKPIKSPTNDQSNQQCGIMISFMNNEQNVSTNRDYEAYIHFYSFELGNYIKLVSETDTIDCMYFNSERNYDVSPISHVFTYFQIPVPSFFNKGKVKLVLLQNDLINREDIEFSLKHKFLKACL
jgi:hypothetical protein